MANRNKFSKALKHLKNKSIDEKLELLEAIPTNNTTGIFVDVPGTFDTEETPAEIDSALDLDQDDSATDTTGLFESDGTIRAVEPPGDTSYVLGPMMSMWYAWGNFTQIGYVRQSDRKMVNLARITGELDNWDGSSNFTSYGQLTLDQAVWFQGQSRADYRAFYPGPPSNPADQHGRYIGSIVNTSKSSTPGSRQVFVPGTNTGFNPSAVFSSILNQSGEFGRAITEVINNIVNVTGDTNAAAANAESNIGMQIAKILTNVAGGTAFNPSLRAIGSQGRGLGGEVRIGQHGTGADAATKITAPASDLKTQKRGIAGFKPGSRQNVYGRSGVFIDPSKSGAAADEFARAGAAAEKQGRETAARSATQRLKDLRTGSGNQITPTKLKTSGGKMVDPITGLPLKNFGKPAADVGEKIPVAYKPGTGSRMNIPGTKYAEVGMSADKATKGARLAQNAATKYPNSAKAAQLVRTGATTAKVGAARGLAKTLGKAVPFAGAAISVADAAVRSSRGDQVGALLSGLTAVPGPVGWTALGAQIATDAAGITGGTYTKDPTYKTSTSGRGAGRRAFAKEEKEYDSYQDYVDRAKETIDKKKIKLDKGLLDVLKTELGLSDKLSDEDKEYLVDLFDDPKNIDPKEATVFIKKIVKKLGSDIKENVHSIIQRNLHEQSAGSGGGTITAHTDAGDVTVNIPSEQQIQQLMPPQPKQGMGTTPEGGVATDYSKNQLRILKGQKSEYFVSGWIQGTAARPDGPAELEKMFAGTTVSWYQVVRMTDEITEIEKTEDEAYARWTEVGDEVFPKIDSLLAQMGSLLTMDDSSFASIYYGKYLPLSRQVDALFDRWDQAMELCISLSKQKLEMSGRLGRYVQSGRLLDPDPFKLNDPTIKKEKELDEQEINDLINQLKSENSELKQRILLNKLKAFGYGALLLAGAAVGFKLLGGVAAIKALGVPVVNMLKRLVPKVKVTKTPVTKPFQNASDDFIRAITDPKNYTRANDAVSRAPKAFKNDVGIQINIGGKTQTVNAADILRFKGFQIQSYRPSGKLLTENQKRILRDIKKPVKVKEMPKSFKVKPTGRNNKVVGAGLMKPIEDPKAFKPDPAIWKAGHKKYNEVSSQDKKNHVLELVGASDHHWSTLIERSNRERQEKVNEAMAQEFDREMEELYEKYQKKETKVDKVIQSIKTKSLDKSKIKPVHPDEPPSPTPNGYHPKYGQKYKHDKLDPHSAEFMPDTGNPVIDANIRKATDQEKKDRKVRILRKPSEMS